MVESSEPLLREILEIIRDVCPPTIEEVSDFDRDLTEYGIDSLDISGILLAAEEKYGVQIPDEDVDGLTTVNAIATYLSAKVDS